MLTKSWRNWFQLPPLLVPKNDFSKIKFSKKNSISRALSSFSYNTNHVFRFHMLFLILSIIFSLEIKLQKISLFSKISIFFYIANSFMTNWCDIFVVFASDWNWFELNFRIFRQIKCRTKLLIFCCTMPWGALREIRFLSLNQENMLKSILVCLSDWFEEL